MAENIRNETLTIGASDTEVSKDIFPPAMRKTLVLTNTSTAAQVITISFGDQAAAGAGIVLYPGGSWTETLDNRFIPSQARIRAIASAAGGALAVHERIYREGV